MTVSIFRQRSRVGPLEKPQQNFPKSYVQSTHRQEWFDNMAMGEVEQDPAGEAPASSRRLSDSSGSGRETEDRPPEVTPVVDLLLPPDSRDEDVEVVTTPVEPIGPGEAGVEGKSEPQQAGGSLDPLPPPPPPLPMELDDPPLSSSLPARDSSHLNPSAVGQRSNTLRPDHCETVSFQSTHCEYV